MKILLTVEFYNPHKGGAEKVVENLAMYLADKGHDVTVATTYLPNRKETKIHGVKVEQFKLSGNSVSGIKGSKAEVERYRNLILGGGFDIIFNYAAQSWPTDLTLPLLSDIKSVKVFAPVGYSRLGARSYKKYFNLLPAYLKRYNALVYHSSGYQDFNFGKENGLESKAVVISNGALKKEFLSGAPLEFRKKFNVSTPYLAVVVAHHNFAKGHRFSIRAFKKMKRDDVTLAIIGDKFVSRGVRKIAHFMLDYLYCFFSGLFDKRIIFAGDGRELALSAYRDADIFMFGSSLECAPLVMYESFASKTPFVSRDVGNVSDYSDYVKIIKTPGEMAEAANHLLDNPNEREKISEKAFNFWQDGRVVEDIADQYEKLLEELNREHI